MINSITVKNFGKYGKTVSISSAQEARNEHEIDKNQLLKAISAIIGITSFDEIEITESKYSAMLNKPSMCYEMNIVHVGFDEIEITDTSGYKIIVKQQHSHHTFSIVNGIGEILAMNTYAPMKDDPAERRRMISQFCTVNLIDIANMLDWRL